MSRIEKAIEKATEKASKLREIPAGQVSHAPAKPKVSRAGQRDRLLDVDPLPIDNPFLVAFNKDDVGAYEEYKKLKSLVVRMTRGDKFQNSFVVTSTVGSEGKSITALNLAMTLAQEYDHTVLLVDADLRKPSVHKYLGIEPKVGLVQCLNGEANLNDALIKTGIGKLVVLPAGGVVSNPVEQLSSDRMKNIITELKTRYPDRYVIVDTPPVLPFAEAQVLSSVVDGVLFVVREGSAKVGDVKEALGNLKDANLLGVVYNDSHIRPKGGKYYYY